MQSHSPSRPRLNFSEYREGVLRGDRVVLSRAITLIESRLDADQIMGNRLVQALLPATGKAMRIGITGIPGVGKSSFIEAFGQYLISISKKVAILAVDPGSRKTKGSILGDKTRMEHLARDENAFIRPSSAGMTLGGVHDRSREAILLCEAAGFDIVIVETVGVGQSEVNVHGIVDFFMLLLMGGTGDELQGIKRGIMEMADSIVITKSDGDNIKKAQEAQSNYQRALHFFPTSQSGWIPQVLLSSAIEKIGIEAVWRAVQQFREFTTLNGSFTIRRKQQVKDWFYTAVENSWRYEIAQAPLLRKGMQKLEKQVLAGALIPPQAAQQFVKKFVRFMPGPD